MGAILPLIVQVVVAALTNAPAVIAEVRAAISASPLTDAQKADLHAQLDTGLRAAEAKVAAVTYAGDQAPVDPTKP